MRIHHWLIHLIGWIVPRRLRDRWQREWQAELEHREAQMARWNRRDKRELTRRSIGAFWDALLLQPRRLEDEMFQDLRFAGRMLLKHKGFTLVAVLSLALGIGGNAAMFSLINGAMIRPLPYSDPDRLARITEYYPKGGIDAMRERSRTMDIAFFSMDSEFNLTGEGEAVHLVGSVVSANFFSIFGVSARAGRLFESGEDRPGRDGVVVLGQSLWEEKFKSDPAVLGRTIMIDGKPRQIIGVAPATFQFPSTRIRLWVPARLDPTNQLESWNTGWSPVVARLRPGVSWAQAQEEMPTLISRIKEICPFSLEPDWNAKSKVISLQSDLNEDMQDKLWLLVSAVGCILFIACANVASLLLARTSARRRELAVRAALGAGRFRLVRQLLTESVALALAGGALGLVLAKSGLSTLKSVLPFENPLIATVGIDWVVLGFLTGLAVLTGLAFGILPALSASRLDLVESLKSRGAQETGMAGARLRNALIVGEAALAVALVISAGLLVKSLWRLSQVDPGFRTEQIMTMRVYPPESAAPAAPAAPSEGENRAATIALYDELVRRARSIPGAMEVAAANTAPLSREIPILPVEMDGHPLSPDQRAVPILWAGAVTSDYFRLLRIPILSGRSFEESDRETSSAVVVVSAETARQYWPGENPIGKRIRVVWEKNWRTVVGVAGDVRQYDLTGTTPDYIKGAFYMPYPQSVGLERRLPTAMTLILRASANAPALPGELRRLAAIVSFNTPVSEIHTMTRQVDDSTASSRSLMWLFLGFGGSALLLAAIGAYGVVSYSTSQRMYEMGVRIALGAARSSIYRLVLAQSLRLILLGLLLGGGAAFVLGRLISGFLYGVTTTDPLTFVAVGVLMIIVGLLAGYLPARRAARVDPMIALRSE